MGRNDIRVNALFKIKEVSMNVSALPIFMAVTLVVLIALFGIVCLYEYLSNLKQNKTESPAKKPFDYSGSAETSGMETSHSSVNPEVSREQEPVVS